MAQNPILNELLKAEQRGGGHPLRTFQLASDALVIRAKSGEISEAHILEALGYLESEGHKLNKYARGCVAGTICLLAEHCSCVRDTTKFAVNWVGCRSLADAEMDRDIASAMSAMADTALAIAPVETPVQVRIFLLCQLASSRRILGKSKEALTALSEALSLCVRLRDAKIAPKNEEFEPKVITDYLESMVVLSRALGDEGLARTADGEAARWRGPKRPFLKKLWRRVSRLGP